MAKKKNEVSILCSLAAEYLSFLTATGQSDVNASMLMKMYGLVRK